MQLRVIIGATVSVLGALLFQVRVGLTDPPAKPHVIKTASSPQQARQAVERSLEWLDKDARKWRKEHDCSTCHHGAMTVWAFSEAKSRGYAVNSEAIAEIAQWTKARFVPPPNQPLDLRPGFNIPSMAVVYLSLSAWADKESITPDEGDRMVKHITDRQESDGAWPTPPTGSPPVFESRETMALWYLLALDPGKHADPNNPSPAQTSREKADAWLKGIEPSDTTQNMALRLLVAVRAGQPSSKLRPAITQLLTRQNADGGWSQAKSLPSDAYATGLALYTLNLAGVKNNRKEVQRGVAFLLTNQKEDGSWPMASRETPERKPAKNLEPIVHIGSAWATLGLMRSLPK